MCAQNTHLATEICDKKIIISMLNNKFKYSIEKGIGPKIKVPVLYWEVSLYLINAKMHWFHNLIHSF